MISPADNNQAPQPSLLFDAITVLLLCGANFFLWYKAGLADSTVGLVAGVVVASWPALVAVLLGPEFRQVRRPRRKDVHVQRAARKVAAVVARSERSSGRSG
jgi:hypothetical protein